MPTIVVVGAQWGDCGKGKIVDYLAEEAQIVVRYSGGPNAGHSLVKRGPNNEEQRIILHQVPSSSTRPGILNIVGPGTVCNPQILMDEIELARKYGSKVMLDPDAHVILPLHSQLDAVREEKIAGKIGTTKRGMGPVHEDIAARRGLTLGQLAQVDSLSQALRARGFYDERAATIKSYGATPMALENLVFWCAGFRSLALHLGDTRRVVRQRLNAGETVLAEGAQGLMLDPYHGTPPFSTPDRCSPAGFSASMGIYELERVIGVAKAYVTRVGGGPFPTELSGPLADDIAQRGHEVGSTTGRPRRVGRLDIPALRHACRVGGIRELFLTKLDILTGIDPLEVCTGYEVDGQMVDEDCTLTTDIISRAKAIFTPFRGWNQPITACRSFDELPSQAQAYLRFITSAVGVPITAIGVGPEREALIRLAA